MASSWIPGHSDRESAYYAHFPDLARQLQDVLAGRKNFNELKFAKKVDFFADWHISIRYPESGHVLGLLKRYDRRFENAKTAMNVMSGLSTIVLSILR